MSEKILISVTGKSGVGKSIFANSLAQYLDAELLSLDNISHLSLKDNTIKQKLKEIFGNEIFDHTGEIERKKLGRLAFNNKPLLDKLNNLSKAFMEKFIDNAILLSNKKYIILEYALLPQLKYFDMSQFKILITASDDIRISRLIKRDNVSIEYLSSREKHIQSFENLNFSEIIENNTEITENLTKIAEKIAKKIQTSIS